MITQFIWTVKVRTIVEIEYFFDLWMFLSIQYVRTHSWDVETFNNKLEKPLERSNCIVFIQQHILPITKEKNGLNI